MKRPNNSNRRTISRRTIPASYLNLGAAYIALGRYDEAIAVLKKGLGIKPTPEVWSNLGGAYMYLALNGGEEEMINEGFYVIVGDARYKANSSM